MKQEKKRNYILQRAKITTLAHRNNPNPPTLICMQPKNQCFSRNIYTNNRQKITPATSFSNARMFSLKNEIKLPINYTNQNQTRRMSERSEEMKKEEENQRHSLLRQSDLNPRMSFGLRDCCVYKSFESEIMSRSSTHIQTHTDCSYMYVSICSMYSNLQRDKT